MSDLTIKDKIPPHNEEAERAALGAMLLDKEAVAKSKFTLKPEDFYNPANGVVYEAICALDDLNVRADILSVIDILKKSVKLDACGGEPYISALTNVVPTSANIAHYIQIVKECSLRRDLIRIASEITACAFDISRDAKEVIAHAQESIFEIASRGQSTPYKYLSKILYDTVMHVHEAMKNKDKGLILGVPSGFTKLDALTSGFQKSEMIVIGARPSLGKTALALNMAMNAAIKNKTPVAFFSLEMSDIALGLRMLSAEAHVDSMSLKTGFMDSATYNSITMAAGNLYELPIYIIDQPNMKLFDLQSSAMRLKAEKNIGIIFIDYLQLIVPENSGRMKDYEQVTEISRSIKGLAKSLDVPIVALSQVGRPSEGNRPSLASLRGSGSIEQDADVVIFLHRERITDKPQGDKQPESLETELIVAKNRNGAVGECKLAFRSKFTQFIDV
ncbi:MAG: replicative DNA helicase [Spirochaetaceae bacterium]|jgi:replicative DNA helicase|nr:replicative DNA helicase [Spirochaetaceae bacterium]